MPDQVAAPPAPPTPTPAASTSNEEFQARARLEADRLHMQRQIKELTERLNAKDAEFEALKKDPYSAYQKLGGNVNALADKLLIGKETPQTQLEQMGQLLTQLTTRVEQQNQELTQLKTGVQKNEYFSDYMGELQRTLAHEDYKPVTDWMAAHRALMGSDYNLRRVIEQKQEQIYKETGKALTPAEAAGMLATEAKARMTEFGSKYSPITTTPTPPAAPQAAAPAASRVAPMTNRTESAQPPVPNPLNTDALIARAVAAGQATLEPIQGVK